MFQIDQTKRGKKMMKKNKRKRKKKRKNERERKERKEGEKASTNPHNVRRSRRGYWWGIEGRGASATGPAKAWH